MRCENCNYCQHPRTSEDNGGACKCRAMKRKTIDVMVSLGETPEWCPLKEREREQYIKHYMEFVLRALELLQPGCKCYMFLKLTFLESEKRFKELFAKQPPKAIYVFSKRVLCAKNGDFERMREGGGSAVAYAWFVWQKGYTGKTEVSWI